MLIAYLEGLGDIPEITAIDGVIGLPISIGQEYHESDCFKATVEALIKARAEHVIFYKASSLQRWTNAIYISKVLSDIDAVCHMIHDSMALMRHAGLSREAVYTSISTRLKVDNSRKNKCFEHVFKAFMTTEAISPFSPSEALLSTLPAQFFEALNHGEMLKALANLIQERQPMATLETLIQLSETELPELLRSASVADGLAWQDRNHESIQRLKSKGIRVDMVDWEELIGVDSAVIARKKISRI